MASDVARAFRLLPSEQVLWTGSPRPETPRDLVWVLAPAGGVVLASVAGLFTALVRVAGAPGWQSLALEMALVALYLGVAIVGAVLAPRYLLDPCEFAITDRRVLWRRGRNVRSIDRHALSFTRVRWHRSVPGVGSLELVRAVPFGPLSRSQRLVFHDLRAPDEVLAVVRGAERPHNAGDDQLPLSERLDPGERVLWGAGPEGMLLGWQDVLTAVGGLCVVALGVGYGLRAGRVLLGLEEVGLPLDSLPWIFLFLASLISFVAMVAVGGALAWHGVVRARAQGRATEYIVTDRRVLIRRGRTELSLDRKRIFDVAAAPAWSGLHTVYLILDGPEARALGDSGALTGLTPARDRVLPVLYELRDPAAVRDVLLANDDDDSRPSWRDAA